jgi:hypothetical protein
MVILVFGFRKFRLPVCLKQIRFATLRADMRIWPTGLLQWTVSPVTPAIV